ncbi:hypothetical protein AHAS_Ahas16G0178100 [Arachis hypogaea]
MPPSSLGEAEERECRKESTRSEREPILPPPLRPAAIACSIAALRGGWPSLCRRRDPLSVRISSLVFISFEILGVLLSLHVGFSRRRRSLVTAVA